MMYKLALFYDLMVWYFSFLSVQNRAILLTDSHGACMERLSWEKKTCSVVWTVSVAGASIIGLRNKSSKSGAAKRFKRALSYLVPGRLKRYVTIYLCLGEVDFGYLYWVKFRSVLEQDESQLDCLESLLKKDCRNQV